MSDASLASEALKSLMTPERKKVYLSRREEDLELCRAAILLKDFETLKNISHRIKGTAQSFGFSNLESIAIALETAALVQDEKKSRELVSEFSETLRSHL